MAWMFRFQNLVWLMVNFGLPIGLLRFFSSVRWLSVCIKDLWTGTIGRGGVFMGSISGKDSIMDF